jgi:hypothetical protein
MRIGLRFSLWGNQEPNRESISDMPSRDGKDESNQLSLLQFSVDAVIRDAVCCLSSRASLWTSHLVWTGEAYRSETLTQGESPVTFAGSESRQVLTQES